MISIIHLTESSDWISSSTGENVIIPTAMKVLHQDPERQEHFRISAENGKKILRLLKGYDLVADHCMAIVFVCAGVRGEDDLIRVRFLIAMVLHMIYVHCSCGVVLDTMNIALLDGTRSMWSTLNFTFLFCIT